jgi:hypothetical protein
VDRARLEDKIWTTIEFSGSNRGTKVERIFRKKRGLSQLEGGLGGFDNRINYKGTGTK